MKRENLYYAIFALLVIIFCAITAMRVFAGSLAGAKREKKKHLNDRTSIGIVSQYGTNEGVRMGIIRSKEMIRVRLYPFST